MGGTAKGGRRSYETIVKKYGADHYSRIGRMGGTAKTKTPKGFAGRPDLASIAGTIGGRNSRRRKVVH